MTELPFLLIAIVSGYLRRHGDLVLENLLLRHQLAVLARSKPRPRLNRTDRLLWVLARRLSSEWRRHLIIVTPDTVVRWHRQLWRLFWRWKSRAVGGRPRLSLEVRQLITTISHENRLWGTQRIRGELLKLGITVSARSIRRYRWRGPTRAPSQTWLTFLHHHRAGIWAADLFTVHTLFFRTLYVLFFIAHDRRQLLHVNVTSHPNAAWVWRQMIEATPFGRRPRFLLRDRDRVYGGDFGARCKGLGTQTLLSPVRAPTANAIAERVVGTFRRECLDHLIIIDEKHLSAVLQEFVSYYNEERPHRTLRLETPFGSAFPKGGQIRSTPVLGGLHHTYRCAA